MFKGKSILITGGTGSFGKQMVKYFLNETEIDEVVVFSRDEEKQDSMRNELSSDRVKYVIGDVRDMTSVTSATRGVSYVFHAAALKQVPSCEFFPMEAVKTNVIGAENVIRAAVESRVERVVVLSTDKAVYPVNVMGMSKAIMEKLIVAQSRATDPGVTTLCATRYGNVMASRGSVIPLFVKQILSGQALTITDPKMTRFLMSLEESVDLVLYALNSAKSGDILVQKAPAATIMTLAKALLTIFNGTNEIRIIGTRHGEKAHETLINREEMVKVEDRGLYFRIPSDARDLNYNKYFFNGDTEISSQIDYNSSNTEILDVDQVVSKLMQLDFIKESLARI